MVCRCAVRLAPRDLAPTYAETQLVSSDRRPFRAFRLVAGLACVLLLAAAVWPAAAEPLRVIAFGDSLCAGFRLPADAAFPAQLEARLRRDGYDARVVNASVSGDTTRGGLARLSYALRDGGDLLILELGANDMLQGVDPAMTRANLEKLIAAAEARGARVLLAGITASLNFGEENKRAFDAIFPTLARERGLPLYPFFLEGVIGETAMTLPDGLHPSREGVARIVAGIAPLVEQSLDSLRGAREAQAARAPAESEKRP